MGNLVYICESEGLTEVARYWQAVVDMNEHQKTTFTNNIISSLFNTVTNKKIAVLGFAFKKDTGDVRETPAVLVTKMLMDDGARVHVYDPKVKKQDALHEFKSHSMEVDESRIVFSESAAEAVDGAHAIVVLTEWDEFKTYPYEELCEDAEASICLRRPRYLEPQGPRGYRLRSTCHRQGSRCRWTIACAGRGSRTSRVLKFLIRVGYFLRRLVVGREHDSKG